MTPAYHREMRRTNVTRTAKLCEACLVLASFLPALASGNLSTPEGLLLLHKMQDALGGAKRIAAVRDFDETIRAEAWDESGAPLGEVRKRTRWMQSPNTLRLDQIGPRGTYLLYLEGGSGSGWEILPDLTSPDRFKTTGTPIALVGGELEFAKGYLSGFEINLWLADTRGYIVTSPRSNVLRIEHDAKADEFTLDPVTALPLKTAGVSLADPNRPVPEETHYGEWREISGVRFPTHRVKYHSGVKRGEVTTEAIQVNIGLKPQELAAKPADFAPDITRRVQASQTYEKPATTPELERRDQPVTEDDLRILAMADELLKDESMWNRRDDRECDDDEATGKRSLFCALQKACVDVTGVYDHRRVALQEVRFAVEDATRGQVLEHRLRDFNNLPATQLADIKKVLRVATDRVKSRLKKN